MIVVLVATEDFDRGPYYAEFKVNTTSAAAYINITKDNKLECLESFTVDIISKNVCSDSSQATVAIEDNCKICVRAYITYATYRIESIILC